MAHPVAEVFLRAADLCSNEEHRSGNMIQFRPEEHLIVSGDLHGNRSNLAKIIDHANLSGDPRRMLVLQELIHGGPSDDKGGDRSFEVLLRVARLKSQYPSQVHVLMGNHDIAQLTGNEITKDGRGVCKAFLQGLTNAYGPAAGEIMESINCLTKSLPLAAKCPNGVFVSHSLPSPGRLDMLDLQILHRPYNDEDFTRGHSIYELVWGRRQDEASLSTLAERLDARLFLTAHQPQEDGYASVGRQLIIGSESPRGVIVEFKADEPLDAESLAAKVRYIAAIARPN